MYSQHIICLKYINMCNQTFKSYSIRPRAIGCEIKRGENNDKHQTPSLRILVNDKHKQHRRTSPALAKVGPRPRHSVSHQCLTENTNMHSPSQPCQQGEGCHHHKKFFQVFKLQTFRFFYHRNISDQNKVNKINRKFKGIMKHLL